MPAAKIITATYDGPGLFEDPGHDGSPEGTVASGEVFEISQERFEQLVAMGHPLSKAPKRAVSEV